MGVRTHTTKRPHQGIVEPDRQPATTITRPRPVRDSRTCRGHSRTQAVLSHGTRGRRGEYVRWFLRHTSSGIRVAVHGNVEWRIRPRVATRTAGRGYKFAGVRIVLRLKPIFFSDHPPARRNPPAPSHTSQTDAPCRPGSHRALGEPFPHAQYANLRSDIFDRRW